MDMAEHRPDRRDLLRVQVRLRCVATGCRMLNGDTRAGRCPSAQTCMSSMRLAHGTRRACV